jgi:hypothetical protein
MISEITFWRLLACPLSRRAFKYGINSPLQKAKKPLGGPSSSSLRLLDHFSGASFGAGAAQSFQRYGFFSDGV